MRRLVLLETRIHSVGIGDVERYLDHAVISNDAQVRQAMATAAQIPDDHLYPTRTQFAHRPRANAAKATRDEKPLHHGKITDAIPSERAGGSAGDYASLQACTAKRV
jgi:hypothetical protein